MKTLNQAIKTAIKKAKEIHGFVIDDRELSTLLVKVESKYSEYITKKEIRYKLSEEEKAERALEDEKKAKEILNF